MGEVFIARDTSTGRDVAVKLLPREVIVNEHRLRRLRREARLLASLNHPNIATLYAFEEEQAVPFLVLELVEGETLAARLRRGALPLRNALHIGVQIAAALAAAHERGVVHRDLKPSNVMLTPQNSAKLLDFGVAREDLSVDESADTVSHDFATTRGHVVGTPAYMSPEQSRGVAADAQTDIWAFGCVLYESLTGKHPFKTAERSDPIFAIQELEPDWRALEGYPAKVRDLIRRCLRKNLAERQRDIADARMELQEALADPGAPAAEATSWRLKRWAAISVSIVVVGLVGAGFFARQRPAATRPETTRRFALDVPGKLAFGLDYPASVALSSDGHLLAYAAESLGLRQVFVRAMDEIQARPVNGTKGGQQPFFSPDGKWLGFFADGKLKKISIRGGAPVVLAEAPNGMGGAWSAEGWIVFAPSDPSGLFRVPDSGGTVSAFSHVQSESGEQAHLSPVLLSDQHTVLFSVYTGGRNTESRLAIQAVGGGPHRIVLDGGSHGHVVLPRWLIYGRGTELLAVDFNTATGVVRGTPFRVLTGVQDTPAVGAPIYAVSEDGTLVYAPAVHTEYNQRVAWIDRSGHVREEIDSGRPNFRPRVSPDGTRVTFHVPDPDYNVWVRDLFRGTRLKLTKDPGYDGFGVWSPDGRQIAFSSARDGSKTLFLEAADGSSQAERLLDVGNPRWPSSWSPNGDWLAFHEEDPKTALDLWLLDMHTKKPVPFLRTPAQEAWARFSPDGRWLAYHSDETGTLEAYIAPLGDASHRLQISAGGGTNPIWSPDGGRLYYTHDAQLVAVPIRLSPAPTMGRPQVLFTTDTLMMINDVSPQGDRFLAADSPAAISINRLEIVLGWPRELARLAEAR